VLAGIRPAAAFCRHETQSAPGDMRLAASVGAGEARASAGAARDTSVPGREFRVRWCLTGNYGRDSFFSPTAAFAPLSV
jgi:hypothetical protein